MRVCVMVLALELEMYKRYIYADLFFCLNLRRPKKAIVDK